VIVRRHEAGGVASEAQYSDCGTYRYLLTRRWGPGESLLFVLLNPSTATEERNDPTVERCERRARMQGFGAFAVTNLFAWRATRPLDLRAAMDPVGPDTDRVLTEAALAADRVICGWGMHGGLLGRGGAVAARLHAEGLSLWHLGLTRTGAPRHPLYVAYSRAPERWT
jgi:hypothetical protein